MSKILIPIKAVYNFIVGDMIILVGILLALAILLFIRFVPALAALRPFSGTLMIIFVVITLLATLAREAYSRARL